MQSLIIIIVLIVVYILYRESTLSNVRVAACDTCQERLVSGDYKDKKKAAQLLDTIVTNVETLVSHMKRAPINYGFTKHQIDVGVRNIESRFSADRIYEINPGNIFGYTAYTQDKENLMLCLRQDDGNLYPINTMMFVVLHELAHMMNDSWGHGPEFWKTFELLLLNAKVAGIYVPEDYFKKPLNYCGLQLTNNPYFNISKSAWNQ